MSNLYDHITSKFATQDALLVKEIESDTTKVDSLQPSTSYDLSRKNIIESGLFDDTSNISEIITGAGESSRNAIVSTISRLNKAKGNILDTRTKYIDDMNAMKDLDSRILVLDKLADEYKTEAYPTLGERIFGASDKDKESRYWSILDDRKSLEIERRDLHKKWHGGFFRLKEHNEDAVIGKEELLEPLYADAGDKFDPDMKRIFDVPEKWMKWKYWRYGDLRKRGKSETPTAYEGLIESEDMVKVFEDQLAKNIDEYKDLYGPDLSESDIDDFKYESILEDEEFQNELESKFTQGAKPFAKYRARHWLFPLRRIER